MRTFCPEYVANQIVGGEKQYSSLWHAGQTSGRNSFNPFPKQKHLCIPSNNTESCKCPKLSAQRMRHSSSKYTQKHRYVSCENITHTNTPKWVMTPQNNQSIISEERVRINQQNLSFTLPFSKL